MAQRTRNATNNCDCREVYLAGEIDKILVLLAWLDMKSYLLEVFKMRFFYPNSVYKCVLESIMATRCHYIKKVNIQGMLSLCNGLGVHLVVDNNKNW